jgi:hypothetical protein
VTPYPFGSGGAAVDVDCGEPSTANDCLRVRSMAFRSWNRGIAATTTSSGAGTPFGVWLFNGKRWFPDPTYPGAAACPGQSVLWAGKLDYWMIEGSAAARWSGPCRFDGVNFLWQPLRLPAATLARVPLLSDKTTRAPGGLTSGTCLSWDDCWFFGNFGVIVHWDGKVLRDASPDTAKLPGLAVEYRAAASRVAEGEGAANARAGAAVGKSEDYRNRPLPGLAPGAPPAQLFTFGGESWSSSPYSPPTAPLPGDPYRTDLVAVTVGADGRGWIAGNATGWRRAFPNTPAQREGRGVFDRPEPAPIVPIVPKGEDPACAPASPDRFTHTGDRTLTPPTSSYPDSYLWTSITAVPSGSTAYAGGQLRPGSADVLVPPPANGYGAAEPVIVEVSCASAAFRATRFLEPVPGVKAALRPVEPGGAVAAIVAPAPNDGWAATENHVYRLGDGRAPDAPAGDDDEPRPLDLKEDPPIFVFAPLPPPPPPPPPVVSTTTKKLPPAIDRIKAKVRTNTVRAAGGSRQTFTLYVTFRVNRPVTIGLEAHRGKRVVATTGLKPFKPKQGTLTLKLNRKRWPTGIAFVTDTPTVKLATPAATLTGLVTLRATATAIRGRRVASVRFDYTPAGANTWTAIGTATSSPFAVQLDTAGVVSGSYDFRAVVTDSKGVAAVSAVVRNRRIQGGGAA